MHPLRFIACAAAAIGSVLFSAQLLAAGAKPAVDEDHDRLCDRARHRHARCPGRQHRKFRPVCLADVRHLYTFDKKGALVPQVATGVTIAPGGLEYRFALRKDVKFHNGAALTARDVKYSFERILDPEVKSTRRPYFAETIDSVTGRMTTPSSCA